MHQNLGCLLKSGRFQDCKYKKKKKNQLLLLSPTSQGKSDLDLGVTADAAKMHQTQLHPQNCDQKVHIYTDLYKILSKAELCFKA